MFVEGSNKRQTDTQKQIEREGFKKRAFCVEMICVL